jgi:eukaryotic-like serine/threonine-protein kinase
VSPQPLTDADPRQVGPYRLLFRLGEGGMGRVYLGRSPGGRTVAVKLVHAEMLGTPGFRERFAREVRASQAVSGTGTVPVVAADADAQVPWLASAYVPGPSLAEAVEEHGPLPPAALWRLLLGLVEALETVHAGDLVHRDLKPSNVLLSLDRPRLIDFGIARAVTEAGLTRTGTIVGSPGYMSPEQAEGRTLTVASDVFSLGGVLAYAATGRGPFGEGTGVELLFRLVHTEPELGGVPEPLLTVVRECMTKDPQHRPSLAALRARAAAALGDGAREGTDWLPAQIASAIGRRAEHLLNLEAAEDAKGQGEQAGQGVATQAGWSPYGQPGQPSQPGQAYTPPPQAGPGFGPPQPTPQPAGYAGYGQPQTPWPATHTGTHTGTGATPSPTRRLGVIAASAVSVVALLAGVLVVTIMAKGGGDDGGSANASASASTETDDPSQSQSASPSPTPSASVSASPEAEVSTEAIVGVWRGSYSCTQGETGLTLTIEETGTDGELAATFEFYPFPDNPEAEEGSFAMLGSLADGRMDLVGDHWIDQPTGYLMVNLSADITDPAPDRIDGSVTSDQGLSSCTTFAVTR